ncbi:MAG TPA: sulfite exporter TauE/SafE family protein [Elusimicrobiales bacterium]|nr:sulfite exporter TauE/SafE family protein [Elusimicrobiales bacterium]
MSELNALNFSILIFFGVFIGLAGSALGIGGGIFMVPFLVLALKLPIHQAVAASLVAIVATSSAVAAVNVERGLANIRLGITLEVTTALGSLAGALAAGRLPAAALQLLFALFLFPVSALMFLKGRRPRKMAAAEPPPPAGGASALDASFFDPALAAHTPYAVKRIAPASLLSFFAGSLSGLLGIGGGIVQVPVMNLLCGVPMKAAAATSNFIIGVSAAASAYVYFRRGLIPLELTAVIVAGVLMGSFLGIYALYRVRSEKLQLAFGALTLLVAVKMLLKAV